MCNDTLYIIYSYSYAYVTEYISTISYVLIRN